MNPANDFLKPGSAEEQLRSTRNDELTELLCQYFSQANETVKRIKEMAATLSVIDGYEVDDYNSDYSDFEYD